MSAARRAGVILHPTSLPSGTLADVDAWLDFLQRAGVGVWQMLPLGIPLAGLSPYQCLSAFALNPALFAPREVDWAGFHPWRERQAHWVEDFALFRVLKLAHGGACWADWPAALRQREPAALAAFRQHHIDAIEAEVREQYACARWWEQIHALAARRGIALFGDMPIFVAHDSADVWARPRDFLLDEQGWPTVVTGVPPDYFSLDGQRWGNPHYNWAAMRENGFEWWSRRMRAHCECFDLVRIDHFRGFAAAWTIPADEPSAIHGYWSEAPGYELLAALAGECPDLKLVAEDLGVITPDVLALRRHFDMPGMGVLQFAFDHFADNPHKPENVEESTVYYTGTHDNDTTAGWWAALDPAQREQVAQTLGCALERVPEAMRATLFESRANLAIVPMQDVLGLGSEARMNTPGTVDGNWSWRMAPNQLGAELALSLREQLIRTGRCPN